MKLSDIKVIKVKHNKTGATYNMLFDDIIECTNGREDKRYVLYTNTDGMIFCREREEFYRKFTIIDV